MGMAPKMVWFWKKPLIWDVKAWVLDSTSPRSKRIVPKFRSRGMTIALTRDRDKRRRDPCKHLDDGRN